MVYVKFEVSRAAPSEQGLKDKVREKPFYYFINHGDFDIVWENVAVFIGGHVACILSFGLFLWAPTLTNVYTIMWLNFVAILSGIGITGGAHRLWAHKSYEARWPLRLILMIGQTIAGQNCIYIWARDHRVHHKWSDTDGDPHNTMRGFFFTHCGWLMRRKHPEVIIKAKTLDFSDLLNDPIVKFQMDYYYPLYAIFVLLIPTAVPVYAFGETWILSFLLTVVSRYIFTLHGTWFVNSAAHMFGERPYNGKMEPAENPWVSFITFGEGYHNYHHQYPSDYQASELGHGFNTTKHILDLMARIGWAFNLKTTSSTVVAASKARARAMNNNSFAHSDHHHEEECSEEEYVIRHSSKRASSLIAQM